MRAVRRPHSGAAGATEALEVWRPESHEVWHPEALEVCGAEAPAIACSTW
jgi:hypothetical protein